MIEQNKLERCYFPWSHEGGKLLKLLPTLDYYIRLHQILVTQNTQKQNTEAEITKNKKKSK